MGRVSRGCRRRKAVEILTSWILTSWMNDAGDQHISLLGFAERRSARTNRRSDSVSSYDLEGETAREGLGTHEKLGRRSDGARLPKGLSKVWYCNCERTIWTDDLAKG